MNEIKFSWIWSIYDARGYERDGHLVTRLSAVPISRMNEWDKQDWDNGYKNRIQMSTDNKRVIKETSYDVWNGCIFIDIDYKIWVKNNPNNFYVPLKMLEETVEFMSKEYIDNFYYAELSRSGCGFHFIFYYDCEHTQNNFDFYTKYTRKMVEVAFEKCDYSDVIHYKGVLDNCTKSFCQCCYLTRQEERYNKKCTGKLIEYKDIKIDDCTSIAKSYDANANDKWTYKLVNRNDNVKVEYIDHYTRWRLFNSLSRVFRNNDSLRNEWERCAKMIPECNGHNTYYYINVPYTICDWSQKLNGNEYVDTALLSKFGYEISVQRKPTIVFEELLQLIEKYI